MIGRMIPVTLAHPTRLGPTQSAHPITFGIADDRGQHYGGDGRKVGYVSGGSIEPDVPAWRERNPDRAPQTHVWIRLDVDALAAIPEIAEAVRRLDEVIP